MFIESSVDARYPEDTIFSMLLQHQAEHAFSVMSDKCDPGKILFLLLNMILNFPNK